MPDRDQALALLLLQRTLRLLDHLDGQADDQARADELADEIRKFLSNKPEGRA